MGQKYNCSSQDTACKQQAEAWRQQQIANAEGTLSAIANEVDFWTMGVLTKIKEVQEVGTSAPFSVQHWVTSFELFANFIPGMKMEQEASELAAKETAVIMKTLSNIEVRKAYVTEVRNLANIEKQMFDEGSSVEDVARYLNQTRRGLGEKYKNLTSSEMLGQIYKRNLENYGDKLGPTYDYLKKQGKTDAEIIESAKRVSKEFNDLAGIE